jgi:transcriptional regulator GlxA family with amidase domain
MLATACSGAVLLAEAGLLDGCDATTHWAYCDALQTQYPKLRVLKERALVVSGPGQRLVMAGGGTSWLDLALYVVAQVVSLDSAMQLARLHLVDWHASGQQPFARLSRTRQVDDREIGHCQEWIAKHYATSAPVASMLRISGLPERTFKRRFKAATGMAPLEYVHTLRLEQAKHLLESSQHSVERIALDVGYEDAAFFARLFRRAVQLSPAEYRRKFGSLRRALGAREGRERGRARDVPAGQHLEHA